MSFWGKSEYINKINACDNYATAFSGRGYQVAVQPFKLTLALLMSSGGISVVLFIFISGIHKYIMWK